MCIRDRNFQNRLKIPIWSRILVQLFCTQPLCWPGLSNLCKRHTLKIQSAIFFLSPQLDSGPEIYQFQIFFHQGILAGFAFKNSKNPKIKKIEILPCKCLDFTILSSWFSRVRSISNQVLLPHVNMFTLARTHPGTSTWVIIQKSLRLFWQALAENLRFPFASILGGQKIFRAAPCWQRRSYWFSFWLLH